jgi:hypothetical protein
VQRAEGFLKNNKKADCFGQELPFPPQDQGGFSPQDKGFRNDRLIKIASGKTVSSPQDQGGYCNDRLIKIASGKTASTPPNQGGSPPKNRGDSPHKIRDFAMTENKMNACGFSKKYRDLSPRPGGFLDDRKIND